MYVVNNQKASAKAYVINDLKSNLTNVSHELGELDGTAAMVQALVQGSYVRADQEMSQSCVRAKAELERALSLLKEALVRARELETREEQPD